MATDQVRPLRSAAGIGNVAANRDIVRHARRQLQDSVELPVAKNIVRRGVAEIELLPFAERQLVHGRERENMRQVESGYASVHLEVVRVLDLATLCSKEARAPVINGFGVGIRYQVSQPLAGLVIQPELKSFIVRSSDALVVEGGRDIRERPSSPGPGTVAMFL